MLHEEEIRQISETVAKIDENVGKILAWDGPVLDVRERTKVIEGVVETHTKEIGGLKESLNKVQVRLGLVLVPLASAIGAVVAALIK